jgi:hypothetical protein
MNDEHGFDHRFGHQDGKSQEMQANQGFRQAFVIPRQPAKTRCPIKTAPDYPAAGQQDKGLVHIRQLDHLQTDAFPFRVLRDLLPGVALIQSGCGSS